MRQTDCDPSIVAIIPLYNGARWIERCLASVLAQTRQPDELIVVNDGSTDDGAGVAIVEKLARAHASIRLLHKPNGGQSSARNFGVAQSRSALIALLDQDDEWYPEHLEALVRPYGRQRGMPLGWTYSNLDVVTDNGEMFARNFLDQVGAEQPKRRLVRALSEDMHVLPSASLIARRAFEAVGGFDERLSGYEDDDLFLRMFCARWDNVYLPQALSFWRMNSKSASLAPRMAKSRMIYAHKLLGKFPDDGARHIYLARDCIAPKFFHLSAGEFYHAIENGNRDVARRALADMAALAPYMGRRKRAIFAAAAPLLWSWLATGGCRLPIRPIAKRILGLT